MNGLPDWPRAHGAVLGVALFKSKPEDFIVIEALGFEPSGNGEHVLLQIEKREANTDWVAKQLARFARVRVQDVGFAGLKDRHGITRQHFTVWLKNRDDVDWNRLDDPEFKILSVDRHERKLKRGAHESNRFEIILREVFVDADALDVRMRAIQSRGVPNYFGPQRFGHEGGNLARAHALFEGARFAPHQASLYLSAARSFLFNEILAERVRLQTWDCAMAGEVFVLDGSASIFGPEPFTEALQERLTQFDIHPSVALWGDGEHRPQADVAAIEQAIAKNYPALVQGLIEAGMQHERRAARLQAGNFQYQYFQKLGELRLQFCLPGGAFATSVLRECFACTEPARGVAGFANP